ncbi:hypothetical protein JW998_16185 [candidate division KSB1 bacterium]|nr:hypothetical protein [candidate division KSB1 bacterium]
MQAAFFNHNLHSFSLSDRRSVFGTRLEKELDIDAKRIIIQIYEDATGLNLLSEKEVDAHPEDEDV